MSRGPRPAAFALFAALALFFALAAAPAAGAGKKEKGEHGEHGEDHEEHGEHEEHGGGHGAHSSRFSDEEIPLTLEGFPQRPKPLLELGEPFLGTGTLDPGLELPTGAVWQPSLLAFGSFRTAIQSFEQDFPGAESRTTEWANRLDLFFNLQLTGSERLVVGFRLLDEEGRFTSYFFESPDPTLDGSFESEFNGRITSLFFEGDFGEIFPNLDREDFGTLDFGFSAGRQPLLFQEGILIADTIDGVGITRNTLLPANTSNFRATFFYGWGDIHRGEKLRGADLFALLTSTDTRRSTIDFDLAYVQSDDPLAGDLVAAGLSAVQRIGKVNTSFRLLHSAAVDEERPLATDGTLLFGELSWTPHYSHDHVYLNAFVGVDRFTSAARGPTSGGPLGRAGINFAAVGLGSYRAALLADPRDVAGGAFGIQKFFRQTRRQLIFEVGARVGLEDAVEDSYAATLRYQAAFGRRLVLVADAFVAQDQGVIDRTPYGGRLELLLKF